MARHCCVLCYGVLNHFFLQKRKHAAALFSFLQWICSWFVVFIRCTKMVVVHILFSINRSFFIDSVFFSSKWVYHDSCTQLIPIKIEAYKMISLLYRFNIECNCINNMAACRCLPLYPIIYNHDDVIKWDHFPCYWPFVRGTHRSQVDSPHKGQWRGALMFSLICA